MGRLGADSQFENSALLFSMEFTFMYSIRFIQNYVIDLVQTVYNNDTNQIELVVNKMHVQFGNIYHIIPSSSELNSFEFAPVHNIKGVATNVSDGAFEVMNYPGKPVHVMPEPGCHKCKEKKK